MKKYLGIDFGTTNSTVAIYDLDTGCLVLNANRGVVSINETTEVRSIEGIPTLYCKNGDQELFGYDCRRDCGIYRGMKKRIRDDFSDLSRPVRASNGNVYVVGEMIKGFLNYLIKFAHDKFCFNWNDIAGVTVTAPICQGEKSSATVYKNFLKSEIENIITQYNSHFSKEDVYVLEEPVAAAISYLYDDNNKIKVNGNGHIMVFDLGGGTLDVSIVGYDSYSNEGKIVAKSGADLGGDDWDSFLQEHILKKAQYTQMLSAEDEFEFGERLKDCKHALSYDEDFRFICTVNGTRIRETIYRKDFERVTESLREDAKVVVEKAKGEYNGTIDKIVLVGGGSNMPQISEKVFYAEDSSKIIQHNPFIAIAVGAAKYAQIRWKEIHNPTSTYSDTKIVDIATHTYGFDSYNDYKNNKDLMIKCMIYEGTSLDSNSGIKVRKKTASVAVDDEQSNVSFTLYEVAKKPEGEWVSLSEGKELDLTVSVKIPDEYKNRATQYEIYPEFVLDKNNILTINLYDANNKLIGEGEYKIK